MKFRERLDPWLWSPDGAYGEGNSQWFFTISIAIQTILLWSISPEIALAFTILWIVHLLSIYLLGSFVEDSIGASVFLIIINVVLIVIGLSKSVAFTLFSVAFSSLLYRWAEIIPVRDNSDYDTTFFVSMILYVIFILATSGAPFVWWVKLIIIVGITAFHQVIDYANQKRLMTGKAFYTAGEKIGESTSRLFGKTL